MTEGPRRPPLVLFDLGGVLVENLGFERLAAWLPEPVTMDALKERWLRSPAVRAFELGSIAPRDFAEAFLAEWALPGPAADFLATFEAWLTGFFPGATDLLADLRRRHRVACLSNSNVLHWARFDGFRGHFDVALSSHLLGEVKPDAACFARALVACDAAARDVVFLDDSWSNVVAARTLGLRAHHVTGLDEVRAALVQDGLIGLACTKLPSSSTRGMTY